MKITLLTGKTFDIQAALNMDIKIIKSTQAKRLTLRIDAKERLPILTIPHRCSAKRAIEFVELHRAWLEENLEKIPVAKRFENGEIISIMGKEYTINHCPQKRCGVLIDENNLIVSGSKEFLHRRICDFIKKNAKEELYKKSKILAAKIGCHVNSVSIKDTKSRWGSCSSLENINYNWRISLAPKYVIDYLVAHEVSHLLHQDHSREFWQCVKKLCPNAAKGRLWLKNHGKELYMYE